MCISVAVYDSHSHRILDLESLYQDLLKASVHRPFSVYKRENTPERWHYRNNARIAPIILAADLVYICRIALAYQPTKLMHLHLALDHPDARQHMAGGGHAWLRQ